MARFTKKVWGPSKRERASLFPYKSTTEKRVGGVLKGWLYEPDESIVHYVSEHDYHPDFIHPGHEWLLVEVKAYFRNGPSEGTKYTKVAQQNKDKEIVFILENPYIKPHNNVKKRKDGSFMVMGEWCAKNGFLFFKECDIPEWFINGEFDRDKLINLKSVQKKEWVK